MSLSRVIVNIECVAYTKIISSGYVYNDVSYVIIWCFVQIYQTTMLTEIIISWNEWNEIFIFRFIDINYFFFNIQ